MQEKTVLKLSQKTKDGVSKNPEKIKNFLFQELQENLEQIRLMVSGYFFLDRKRIYGFTIDETSIEINNEGHGSFNTRFTIGILDGCSDIDKSQPDCMIISLSTNLKTGEILLTGENIPERQPDDF